LALARQVLRIRDGIFGQIEALNHTKTEDPYWSDYNQNIDDLNFVEALVFFSNRYVEDWTKNPSTSGANSIIADLNRPVRSQNVRIRNKEVRTYIDEIHSATKGFMDEKLRQ
jgi:hypothetical protein